MSDADEIHSVLITGATGAIGSALARAYAKPGVTLFLQGRKVEQLALVAGQCKSLGAEVATAAFDLRERERLADWLTSVCQQKLPDLVIVNAGINIHAGPDNAGEDWREVETLLEVNIRAAMATVNGVLPAMRQRGQGQIALLSS